MMSLCCERNVVVVLLLLKANNASSDIYICVSIKLYDGVIIIILSKLFSPRPCSRRKNRRNSPPWENLQSYWSKPCSGPFGVNSQNSSTSI